MKGGSKEGEWVGPDPHSPRACPPLWLLVQVPHGVRPGPRCAPSVARCDLTHGPSAGGDPCRSTADAPACLCDPLPVSGPALVLSPTNWNQPRPREPATPSTTGALQVSITTADLSRASARSHMT